MEISFRAKRKKKEVKRVKLFEDSIVNVPIISPKQTFLMDQSEVSMLPFYIAF